MLFVAILGLVSSFWLTWVTIRLAQKLSLGADESGGVQKFHDHWVPRLGGLPVFLAFCVTLLQAAWINDTDVDFSARLIVCLLPAFGIGLLEDVTRKAGVTSRLLLTMVAAAIGWWLIGAKLTRVDVMWIDSLLFALPVLAFVVTLVAAGGLAHAVNIIDGYNGLSSFYVAAAFVGLAVVAWQTDDVFLTRVAIIAAASTAGFFVWNFPSGRIFLGDAGAYFLGFLLAEVSMMLVLRNPEISAWCPMLIIIYPVWETLFSVLRRASGGMKRIGQPDALHLHQLVYRRLMKRYIGHASPRNKIRRNSFTSMYLWIFSLMSIVPAVFYRNERGALIVFCLLFIVTYVVAYRRLVRFNMPRWLVAAPKQNRQPESAAK